MFDQLVANADRNDGNILITNDWMLRLIDHSQAFGREGRLSDPGALTQCDRRLLRVLRELDEPRLRKGIPPEASERRIKAFMLRREAIVRLFDERIERLGEEAVLFDYLVDPTSPPVSTRSSP